MAFRDTADQDRAPDGPTRGGLREPLAHSQIVPVVVDPLAQSRPGADQRLVHDLDAPVVDREQPLVGERVDDGRLFASVSISSHERRRRVSGVSSPGFTSRRNSRRATRALVVVEPFVGVLGRLRDGADDAAGRSEPVEREQRSAPAQPRLQQRVRDEGQRARLVAGLVEDRLGEAGFEPQSGALRRAFNRTHQLVAPHRADEDLIVADAVREPRIARARRIEVGPQSEHDSDVRVG